MHCCLSLSEALERGIQGRWLARLSSMGPGAWAEMPGAVQHVAYVRVPGAKRRGVEGRHQEGDLC